jgi:hypothetical protein
MPDVPRKAYKVSADRNGYVTHFQLPKLLARATTLDVCVRYNLQIGEYINRGAILAYVWDAKTKMEYVCDDNGEEMWVPWTPLGNRFLQTIAIGEEGDDDESYQDRVERRLQIFVAEGVKLSKKRDSDLDVTLGIQQLADIAVRALSPGVNDPHTAIQCMDVLTALLATLAHTKLGVPNARDKDGNLRVWAPRRSFESLLSMLDGIRRYGATDMTVCRRGLRMYGELGAILTRTGYLYQIPPCVAQLEQWMSICRTNFVEGGPELRTLQELYDHMLRNIAESGQIVLKDHMGVKNLQDFETTYKEEAKKNISPTNVVMEFLSKVDYTTPD